MTTSRGMIKIDGIGIADLPRIGLYATETIATGERAMLGDEPAAREMDGGVLIVHGHSDLTEESGQFARTFGARVVAVSLSSEAGIFTLEVTDGDGTKRHLVDALEESSLEKGRPFEEESGQDRLTEESALSLFERLTGTRRDDIAAAEFQVLRPAQEHDETEERPFVKRLFGLH